jgi:CubicO group peptidase (beta-lactamase class C family)
LYGSDIERVHRDYRPNADPGIFFDYQSGNTEVLCFILSKVTKKSVSEYASEKLWKPIGAEHPARWSLDHINGIEKGYCCFNSNARDFAKFGQLYLNKGMVQGDALIDPIYFDMATNQAKLLTLDGKKCTKYGYQWWILDSAEEHIFYARGIQGQYIFILPKSGLVIVRLGHSRTQEQHNGHPLDVYEYIKLGKRLAGVN